MKMKWSKNILTGEKSGQGKKLFQTHVDRKLSDEFRIICISLGRSQKDLIEVCMIEKIKDYMKGVLV
jgi:hypothetical protein